MTTRQDALEEIADIARRHSLTAADIAAHLSTTPAESKKAEGGGLVSKLLGYMGGILVFAGIGVYIAMFWEEMGTVARIAVTLGTGFMVFFLAVAAHRDEKYTKAATPLFLAAALLQPMGILVALREFSSGGNPSHGVIFMCFIMLLQQGLTFAATQRSVLAFTSIFFGSSLFFVLFDLLNWDDGFSATVLGTSLLMICHAAAKSRHRDITPFWFFISTLALQVGVFDMIRNSPVEILFLGLCAYLVFYSTSKAGRCFSPQPSACFAISAISRRSISPMC